MYEVEMRFSKEIEDLSLIKDLLTVLDAKSISVKYFEVSEI